MNRQKAEQLINRLATEANDFLDISAYNNSFEVWRGKVIRYLSVIFGADSLQVKTLQEVKYPNPSPYPFEGLGSVNILLIPSAIKRFEDTLKSFLDDLDLPSPAEKAPFELSSHPQKIFISHSSKDHEIAKEVTKLLEAMGVPDNKIFNSSMPGYGVKPGENWPEALHTAISSEGVVISLLSDNYFKSAVCLCEMGATWVLAKTYYPVVIPPLTFKRIKGVMPTTHGIMINDSIWWSALKEVFEEIFDLKPIPGPKWEGKKKDILERIEKLLPTR